MRWPSGRRSSPYNKRNRLDTATVGALPYAYGYNALEQLVSRQQTAGPSPFTTHFVHDIFGNIIAETAGGGATGATGTVREYIWLPETEIAPTASSRTTIDRPLAVVDAVNTAAPATWWVSVDHLNRPVKMTDAARASVWDAVWLPWGGVHSITGAAALDARFPGQWFQTETGLHYNWHRSYDPTLGRYTQPDPLGFVDGPSVYGYAVGSPGQAVDPDGRQIIIPAPPPVIIAGACIGAAVLVYKYFKKEKTTPPTPKRCEAILRGCQSGCARRYEEDPDSLPGSGRDYAPRIRQCIRDCMQSYGCPY